MLLLYYLKRIITCSIPFISFLLPDYYGACAQPLAPSGKDTFGSPGLYTWVCPADVTCIKAECWGGGGRGGNQTVGGAGGGGGGGAYASTWTIPVVPGNTYYINVGNGSSTVLPGGDSWFGSTSQPSDAITLAKGGNSEADNGVFGASGGSAASSIGDKKFSGGAGGRSLTGFSGGGGGGAGSMGMGGNASGRMGGIGTPLYGGNGGDGLLVSGNGNNGYNYGGGGSGEYRGATDFLPGNGAPGQVIISYITAFQVTPVNGSFCDGALVNIGLSGSETGVKYQLLLNANPQGNQVSGTGNAISFGNQNSIGTYTVTATLDSSACTRLMNGSVVIHSEPVVTLAGPTPVCAGSSGNIYTTQPGMSNYAWVVSPGGTVTAGGTPVDNTITISWISSGTRTVSVNYSDANGCSADSPSSFNVNVVPQSADPLSAAAIPPEICYGQSATLALNGGGGGTGAVIRWYSGSCGGILAGTGNNLTVSPTVTTTYYGRYEDQPPCGNSACAQVTVTVHPNPVVSAGASTNSVCIGTPFNLYSSSNISYPPVLIAENFQSAVAGDTTGPNGWTTARSSTGGIPANSRWTVRGDGYVTDGLTFHSNDNSKFYLSDSRSQGSGTTRTETYLTSPVLSTVGYSTLSLNFFHYFRFQNTASEAARVQVSTNGTVWTTVATYTANQGSASSFVNPVINLNSYVNNPVFYIRFYYFCGGRGRYWAIDNVSITGTPAFTPIVNWTSNPAGFSSTDANPVNVILNLTTTYTVTYTNPFTNCSGSASVTVTALPLPEPKIIAKYCAVPGYIRLIAHPMPPGYTYLWNTGETTDSIDVDIAGVYWVKVTNISTTCSATAYLTTATELVTDGTFTNFVPASPTFFTEYTQNQSFYTGVPSSGLWPEGYYAVNLSAWSGWPNPPQGYHPHFHGRDHTNNPVGPRNFMMINGSKELIGIPPHERIIWQQTVPVWPNTDYYFSAWGMNLNPNSPAKLRFEVNGVQVGTIADLNLAPKPTSEDEVNLANYVRFYSNPSWNSGSATTAVIRIINLNLVAGGNDFGLDDISFGTLAPIPFDTDPEANQGGPVCKGGVLSLTTNVDGGIGPFSYLWTGPDGWTSSLENPSRSPVTMVMGGIYTVLVSDLGSNCPGFTSSLMVTVNPKPDVSITGNGLVCPSSVGNQYNGIADVLDYQWAITGNGTIQGPTDEPQVSVTAGLLCDNPFTLTLTVTDSLGCDSTITKTIVVNDTIPPMILCPPDTILKADTGLPYATLTLNDPVFSDNCTPNEELELSWIMTGATDSTGSGIIPSPFLFSIDTTFVSYFLQDHCDNRDTCTFMVIVLPNYPPEMNCPDSIQADTDVGLCTATLSPGFPTLNSGTPPVVFSWTMTGATTGSGTGPISPDPFTFNQGMTIITWIAANSAGADTCQQLVAVIDEEPPLFDLPGPFVFCVLNIDTASWNFEPEPLTDIEPARPDYYIIAAGETYLDLDTASFQDNCCDPAAPDEWIVYWRIDFSDGTSLPPLPGTYITGQPSAYGSEIILPGDGIQFNELFHSITYRLADCNGNLSDPASPVTITIKPRPKIVKIY